MVRRDPPPRGAPKRERLARVAVMRLATPFYAVLILFELMTKKPHH